MIKTLKSISVNIHRLFLGGATVLILGMAGFGPYSDSLAVAETLSSADFESGFGDWVNVTGEDSHDWTRDSGGTQSPNTGPDSGAYGSTWYVYLECSSGGANDAGDTAYLEGPEIDGSNRELTFYYHMYGAEMGTLNVDVYDGSWHEGVWSISSQQHTSNSEEYTLATVNLSAYTGTIKVRFRAVAAGGWQGDMAVDDIEVTGDLGDVAPAAPTGLGATAGDGTVSLDWDDNSETDLDGYNVYRSLTSGSGYGLPLNGSLLNDSDYIDNDVNNETTYYYVVTAVDVNDNESDYSNERSATPSLPPIYVDYDGSGFVDFNDFARFASAWSSTLGEPAFDDIYDIDGDDDVDTIDLYYFGLHWLEFESPPPPPIDREKLSFNTGWKFYKGAASGSPEDPSYDDSSWLTVSTPHNPPISGQSGPDPLRPPWGNYSYEGVSWYRKHFNLDPNYNGKKIYVEFEAINTVADVWINDTHLTTHYGGYLPFTVDITDYANFGGTENVIAVRADNTFNPDVPIGRDGWFNWGGIYRDVWLHVTDKLHVTDAVYAGIVGGGGIFVTYPSVSTSLAQVQVKTHVLNEYTTAKSCTVETYIVDDSNMVVAEMNDTQSISASGDYTFTQLADVTDPCLWHPDHPYLYTVLTEVYDADSLVDTYQTRIGIRSISFSKAEGFKINGQVLRFRGTNRLQDYPYIGYAMGNIGQRRDAERLKEAGFELVRTAHYPQDPAFMEACDELGIMIMDEIPGFQYQEWDHWETFKVHSYQNMRDMIRRDRNHPCVIAWELSLNETWWEDTTYSPTAVSIGHAEYPGDQCYVAGWKDAGRADPPDPPWEPLVYDIFICTPSNEAREYYDENGGTLPLVIDEYGHWEYNYNGYSDVHRMDGETAMLNQILNHQDGLNKNRGMPYLCGDALWVGIDYGPYPQGVLDSLRLPKFSYYFFQSQRDPDVNIPGIDSGPMVFIANYWTASSPITVKVFSNCQEVKLYKNGDLQATQTPDTDPNSTYLQHPPFTFTGLSFTSGELKAEGLIDGGVVATHIVNTPGSADSLLVEFDVTEDVPANGSETIAVNASIVDSSGTLVPTASSTSVTFSVTGPATLASPATITSEAGIATGYIRVTDLPGLITVTATASGLTTDDASIISY